MMTIEEKRKKHAEYMRNYYALNKERVREINARSNLKHYDRVKDSKRKYRIENRNKIYEWQAEWRDKNRDKIKKYTNNYIESRPKQKGRGYLIAKSGNRKITHKWIYRPEHPHCDKKGYVLEHRLTMENIIGRYLTRDEVVHHKDKNGLNNDPSNLQLMTIKEHNKHHQPQRDGAGRFLKVA